MENVQSKIFHGGFFFSGCRCRCRCIRGVQVQRLGAAIADLGGAACRAAIGPGVAEWEVADAGVHAMKVPPAHLPKCPPAYLTT